MPDVESSSKRCVGAPALYRTRITHLRRDPVHHYFEHRSYSWFVDIDDTFEGRVEGDAVRLTLNKNMEVRVKPNPNYAGSWIGTIRVRMDPRPYADPYWVEQPFSLASTANQPCWWVHLQPPYCIFYP